MAPITTVSPPAPAERAARRAASAGGERRRARPDRASASARARPASISAEQPVDGQRQRGRGGAAEQHADPVLGLQAGEDVVAEAGLADRGRERGGADRPDRGGADAGEDHRRAERQLDHASGAGARSCRCRRPPRARRDRPLRARRRRSAGSAAGHRGVSAISAGRKPSAGNRPSPVAGPRISSGG